MIFTNALLKTGKRLTGLKFLTKFLLSFLWIRILLINIYLLVKGVVRCKNHPVENLIVIQQFLHFGKVIKQGVRNESYKCFA